MTPRRPRCCRAYDPRPAYVQSAYGEYRAVQVCAGCGGLVAMPYRKDRATAQADADTMNKEGDA